MKLKILITLCVLIAIIGCGASEKTNLVDSRATDIRNQATEDGKGKNPWVIQEISGGGIAYRPTRPTEVAAAQRILYETDAEIKKQEAEANLINAIAKNPEKFKGVRLPGLSATASPGSIFRTEKFKIKVVNISNLANIVVYIDRDKISNKQTIARDPNGGKIFHTNENRFKAFFYTPEGKFIAPKEYYFRPGKPMPHNGKWYDYIIFINPIPKHILG